jgi:hypothetical protein
MKFNARVPRLSGVTRWSALASVLVLGAGFALLPRASTSAAVSITGLHVQGNTIVNSAGQTVRLLGVDRSGTEYACVQGWGFFDGPSDLASVQAMASWHVNAVRVPLNEDCWLGINGVNPTYSGTNYQNQIVNYVNLLNSNGLVAILDLHWNAAGTARATGQQPMPDADHAPAFWESVAGVFKNNSSVIFDLYNEPYPDSNRDTTAAWTCWRDGSDTVATNCPGVGYTAVGMQELVTDVRNSGANNILMLGGVDYSNSLTQWLTFKPTDPQNNLAASWHSYNFNICNTSTCWDSTIAPVAQKIPVIAGEIGENDCAHGYIDQLMPWMDSHGVSYLGWTWDTWNCSSGPALISDYAGTPTNYGIGFRDHLNALANSTPTSTPTSSSTTGTPTSTSTAVVNPTSTATPTITPTKTRTPTPTTTPTPKPKHHH